MLRLFLRRLGGLNLCGVGPVRVAIGLVATRSVLSVPGGNTSAYWSPI